MYRMAIFPLFFRPILKKAPHLNLAIKKAEETDADIVLATDPDADRVGVVVKNNKGKLRYSQRQSIRFPADQLSVIEMGSKWQTKREGIHCKNHCNHRIAG